MTKLRELEKRLKDEPDNLGLRVMAAGAMIEAGRRGDAVELYRSVAIAYRDLGRPHQAITVCRSVLELAPDDAACRALLDALISDAAEAAEPAVRPTPAPASRVPHVRLTPPKLRPPSDQPDDYEEVGAAPRRSSYDITPLPEPLPYHVADPTRASQPRLVREDEPRDDHPASEIEGIASAARQISASLIAASRQAEEAAEAAAAVDALARSLDASADHTFDPGEHDAEDDDATIDAIDHAARLDATADVIERAIRSTAPGHDGGFDADAEVAEASAVGAELLPDDEPDDAPALPPVRLGAPDGDDLGADGEARDGDAGEPSDDEPTFPPARAPGAIDDDPELAPDAVEDEPGFAPAIAAARARRDRADEPATRVDDEPMFALAGGAPRNIEDEVTSPRDLPAGVRAAPSSEASQRVPRRGPDAGGLAARDSDPHARPTLSSRDLAAGARPTIPLREPPERLQAALPAFAPDPASSGRASPADSRVRAPGERGRPPSIAPATQASGPLASVLFAPIPPRNRAAVLQRFQRRLAAVGTTVIRRGELGHGLVLVVAGQLDVHAERADGARVSLDAIGPGDHVGEIGLLSRSPAAAYVVAATDSELLVLPVADFYDVTRTYPALWAQLSAVAERRARDHAHQLQG